MDIEEYRQRVDAAKRIVFFGGAGVSTESGIPDFRSAEGRTYRKYDELPETILSADYFYSHPTEFYKFYFDKMIFPNARPNAAHVKLAEWEKAGKLSAVVTQNIDGLHQTAGSKNVFELHGAVRDNHCTRCGKYYSLADIYETRPAAPRCSCGGIIKPDVVLYGEQLPERAVVGAIEAIRAADMLIIGGTSLAVYPAAGFVHYFGGDKNNLVVINLTPVAGFKNQLNGKIGELL